MILDFNAFEPIINLNRTLRFCLAALITASTVLVAAAGESRAEDNALVKSTVLSDRRTGRLVRRIVLTENIIEPRILEPRPVAAAAPPKRLPAPPPAAIDHVVREVAAANQVDPLLVHAIIQVESAYNPYAVSPKGAEGLMQLIPSTAREMGVRNSFDSRQNIEGGVRYLRQLQNSFADLRHVLAAYNAGEAAVKRYGGIPPYTETQEYVYKVGRRLGELRRSQRPQSDRAAVAGPPPVEPGEPVHRPLEASVDSDGRLTMRTR
jgi:hypothetical protein